MSKPPDDEQKKYQKAVGRRIKIARNRKRWSRDTLADKIGVGVNQIKKYELGLNLVRQVRLAQIARHLDVSVAWLEGNGDE